MRGRLPDPDPVIPRQILRATDLAALIDVSRETLERFEAYLAVLVQWNRRINLVGASTLADPWRRHILDSAQLYRLLPPAARILVDLGSGAGLPGLILAIQGVPDVHLIESDNRKAAFLFEAARVTATPITIHAKRIEAAPAIAAEIVTARALKPLAALLGLTRGFAKPETICYFHKGESWRSELAEARSMCHSQFTIHPSLSDPASVVIEVKGFPR